MPIDPKQIGEQVAPMANGRKWIIAPCSKCGHDFGFFEGTQADAEGEGRICTSCWFFDGTVFEGALSGL